MGFGILMVGIVVLLAVWAFSFLLGNAGTALDKQLASPQSAIRFEIDRAQAVIKK